MPHPIQYVSIHGVVTALMPEPSEAHVHGVWGDRSSDAEPMTRVDIQLMWADVAHLVRGGLPVVSRRIPTLFAWGGVVRLFPILTAHLPHYREEILEVTRSCVDPRFQLQRINHALVELPWAAAEMAPHALAYDGARMCAETIRAIHAWHQVRWRDPAGIKGSVSLRAWKRVHKVEREPDRFGRWMGGNDKREVAWMNL